MIDGNLANRMADALEGQAHALEQELREHLNSIKTMREQAKILRREGRPGPAEGR